MWWKVGSNGDIQDGDYKVEVEGSLAGIEGGLDARLVPD